MTSSSPSPSPSPPPSDKPTRQLRYLPLLALSYMAKPLGFTRISNFILFFIFGGALLGFALARLPYLSFSSGLCPEGGGTLDCYYYTPGSRDKIGIMMHLSAILPASLLAILQFIPKIRHKLIHFHRMNGYVILCLAVISTIGAGLLGPNLMGGEISAQAAGGTLGLMFLVSLFLAWYNIKRLQIEQHRAWMLRAWFYAGSIISMRLIMMIMDDIESKPSFSPTTSMPCAKIAYFFGGNPNATLSSYPDCGPYFSGEDLEKSSSVRGDLNGDPVNVIALFTSIFGTNLWLSLFIHAIGVEIYLHLTPAEANRLRNVSYQRQLEAGMKTPGRMGLTADKLGYSAPWVPSSEAGTSTNSVHVIPKSDPESSTSV
ncbi:hypothetical protein QBC43DRAFT_318616 [Cladorrhinum sp. PSN259]|nr:hypothetical protein QBC43DRAFT_318616 [Cladorrhinum sp. PSN259]